MTVQFARFTAEERAHVDDIVTRAQSRYRAAGIAAPARLELIMDLAAVHARCPLRLAEMAAADDADLMHDIIGIRRHLDRRTGELRRFAPRFARATRQQ